MSSVNLPWVNDHNGMVNWNFDTDASMWSVNTVVGTWTAAHLTSPHTFVAEQSSYYGGGFGRLRCNAASHNPATGYLWRGLSLSSSELNKPMRFSTLIWNSKNDNSITVTVKIGSSQGGGQFYESSPNTNLFFNLGNIEFTPTTSIIFISIWMSVVNPVTADYIGVDYFSLDRQENALTGGVPTTWSSEALVSGTSWS